MTGNRTRTARRFLRPQLEPLEDRTLFAFGVTTGTTPTGQSTYVIDNGGDLKFSVINGGPTTSTIHLGDISSIQYKGHEMLATYAESSRYSHYEQGLGSGSAITYTIGGNNSWILVTCDDSAASSGAVIQYYVVRKGDNNIYMASLPIDVTNGPGEGRFIAYLDRSVFSTPEAPSDNAGTTGAIEGSDVFGHPDGTTTSKFYNSGRRMIDNVYHGLTGTAGTQSVGAWMYMGNRETSSGGPFFKDIDYQSSDSQVEIYNCLFTGHTQTEPFRQGLKGPYAFQFTDGSAPATPDYSWMDALNLQGWTPASGRGSLTGTASGVPAGHDVVVALANSTAQYWIRPDSTGHYSLTGILPGTYTETLYDTELGVGTKTVTISAGATTSANITDTFYVPSNPIFRIGTWDGTPAGFLNADKISIMHPSDVRMADWNSTPNFVVGTNTDADWPLAQFMGVNNSQRITFTLSAAQVQNLTLRIGITWDFSGARNKITVNAGQSYAWTSANPGASADLNSRGITRGTWRGVNQLYTFNIPASSLRAGTNTIDLPLISGSYQAGQTWLSPNVSYDAIDLIPTSSASAPSIASVTVTPSGSTVGPNGTVTYAAVAKDSSGHVVPANFNWSATRGTIDPNGNYTAPAAGGTDTITATAIETGISGYATSKSSTSSFSGTLTGAGSTTVNVLAPNAAPTVATQASATPNPANGTTATLSVFGADDAGESNLTYTWSAVGTPPDPVTLSSNGTNAAKTTTATFTMAGTYTLQATITDSAGLSTTSTVTLTVNLGLFSDSRDIGSPTTPGSLSFNPSTGTYTIQGNGADIWGTSDQFRYSYTTLPGPGQMIARVTSVTNTSSSAKAGVMLRDSAAPSAAYAFVWLSPGNLVKFETRSATGTTASYSASVSAASPVYLKLLRSGPSNNQFTAYYSPNGTTWTQVGLPQTVTMASTALAGLAVTSHSSTTLNTATFDHLSLTPIVTGDQSSANQPDSFLLTRNGPYLDLYLNNTTSTPTYRYDPSSITSLILNGQGGPDTLTLDLSNGSPFPAGGLSTDAETITAPYTGPTPVAAIRQALATNQLTNPTATGLERLGYLDTGSSINLKLTTAGDANLDGKLDADDYALTDRGYAKHLTTWTAGDFNYDGIIDASDYLLLDTAYQQQQGGQPSPSFLSQREARFGPAYVTALAPAAPTATLTGPTTALANQPVTLHLSATDPSSTSASTPLTYTLDWNNDGAPDQTLTAPASGLSLRHTFKTPGSYTITLQATNQSGTTSQPVTLSILIQPPDPSKHRAHLFSKRTTVQSLFATIDEKKQS